MSRRNISKKRFPQKDSVYSSFLVSLLISRILKSGKKNLARNIVHQAFEIVKKKRIKILYKYSKKLFVMLVQLLKLKLEE